MPISNKTVLIVEDSKSINKMLKFLFMSRGCTVEFAMNGIDALKILEKTIPDVIILDLMMPEMDGFELCGRLKDNSKHQDIPVVVLTASTDANHKERIRSMGVYDYVEKPFSAADIVERVTKVI